jgi:hypothetical protein
VNRGAEMNSETKVQVFPKKKAEKTEENTTITTQNK